MRYWVGRGVRACPADLGSREHRHVIRGHGQCQQRLSFLVGERFAGRRTRRIPGQNWGLVLSVPPSRTRKSCQR